MLEFEAFYRALKHDLRLNRKPIVLFFGNGYDSQILLASLSKIRRKIIVVYVQLGKNPKGLLKAKRIAQKFAKFTWLFLRVDPNAMDEKETKTWTVTEQVFLTENHSLGFGFKDYVLITGHKLHEPYQIKAFEKGLFKNLFCPLLRFSDDWITRLYQNMKDTDPLGKFLNENLDSDSAHPSISIS